MEEALDIQKFVDTSEDESEIYLQDLQSQTPSKIGKTSIIGEDEVKIRLPTRRPNPNVFNRNALLARENRRRKKEHLENVERELQHAKRKNELLSKALKKQLKITHRLQQEKQYFKKVMASRSEISSLVSYLNSRLFHSPKSCAVNESNTISERYRNSVAFTTENGNLEAMNFDNFYSNFDIDVVTPCSADLSNLHTETEPKEDLSEYSSSHADSIYSNDDHNYVMHTQNMSDNVGVCLHFTNGKVSLEFCPVCHLSASETEPIQF